jgi:hypothetical protein
LLNFFVCFIEDFCIYVHQGNWLIVFFLLLCTYLVLLTG